MEVNILLPHQSCQLGIIVERDYSGKPKSDLITCFNFHAFNTNSEASAQSDFLEVPSKLGSQEVKGELWGQSTTTPTRLTLPCQAYQPVCLPFRKSRYLSRHLWRLQHFWHTWRIPMMILPLD